MKRMKSFVLGCLVLSLGIAVSGTSLAKKKKSGYKYPYGMAGCGLGALVVDRNELLPQLGAWFLNGIYSNQTYGITSGTSHCVSAKSMALREQEVYLKANFASVSKEAAQGTGTHLEAFADVMGCEVKDWDTFAKFSKKNYTLLFSDQDVKSVLSSYRHEISNDDALAKSCSRVS